MSKKTFKEINNKNQCFVIDINDWKKCPSLNNRQEITYLIDIFCCRSNNHLFKQIGMVRLNKSWVSDILFLNCNCFTYLNSFWFVTHFNILNCAFFANFVWQVAIILCTKLLFSTRLYDDRKMDLGLLTQKNAPDVSPFVYPPKRWSQEVSGSQLRCLPGFSGAVARPGRWRWESLP